MKYSIALAIAVFTVAIAIKGCHSSESAEEAFKKFQQKFKKRSFRTLAAEKQAFENFKENHEKIVEHNKLFAQGLVSFRLGDNERMDWTQEKVKAVNNYIPPSADEIAKMPKHKPKGQKHRASGPIYGYQPFDWRDQGAVPPVRNQGSCGSCGPCSKTDAVSSALAIRNKSPAVALSVQAVLDCDYGNSSIQPALDTPMFIMKYGIPTEADYPYMAASSSYCVDPNTREKGSSYDGCKMWDKNLVQPFVDRDRTAWMVCAGCYPINIKEMVDGLINGGPLQVGIYSSCSAIANYKNGVIRNSGCYSGVDHAVLIVGVGVETIDGTQVPYWIVKNSWGDWWGEKGYFRVAIGSNDLNMERGGYYVSLTKPAEGTPEW